MTQMIHSGSAEPFSRYLVGEAKFRDVMRASGMSEAKIAKLAYSIADIHVDSFLSNFAIDYHVPEKLIADDVCPVVPVDKPSNKYPIWSRDDANKVVDTLVGPRDFPAEITQSLSSDSYTVKPNALWSPVPNDLLLAADAPLNLLGQAARDVRGAVAKSRELRVATLLLNTGSYAYQTTILGNNKWDVGFPASTADPVSDIMTYMDRAATRPNMLWFSQPVWTAFRKHPRVLGAIKGSAPAASLTTGVVDGIASEAGVRELFQVEAIHIGNAKYRSSAQGAAAVYDFIWGTGMGGLVSKKGASINELCFAKTFRHVPITFQDIFDIRPGMTGVNFVKAAFSETDKVTADSAAFFLAGCIS